MNKQELIEKIENLNKLYGERYYVAIDDVLNLVNQLDEPEKPIRLKDVIKRIKGFDDGTKFKWTYDILQELGSDFGSKMLHEAYQQGRFDEGMDAYYGRDKVEIPQFVADWYEENKDDFETNLFRVIDLIPIVHKEGELSEFEEWIVDEQTAPFQTLVNMHQFGYKVEEKRYWVKMKGISSLFRHLKYNLLTEKWYMGNDTENEEVKKTHTRKELEEAGFGEVFNSPLFEVEEVAE